MSDTEVVTIPQIRQVFYATYANLPTTGVKAGDLGFATDRLVLYRWSGSAWESISIASSSGLFSARPTAANLPNNSLYYATDTAILYQVQSGSWVAIVNPAVGLTISVSDTLENSNDAEKTTNQASYTKIKECKLNEALSVCRIKFDLKFTINTAYAKIYKNGVAIGTEQSDVTGSWATKTEDFAGFAKDDLIQVYGKAAATGVSHVQNFRFYYNRPITSIGGHTLTTPLTITDSAISVTNQDP